MPIYLTHRCNRHCFFCPVPAEYFGRDLIIVGDHPVEKIEEIPSLLEGLGGASISGGEPLVVSRRVAHVARLLKQAFGDDFHIHLYSNGSVSSDYVRKLIAECGIDEIRLSSFLVDDYVAWVSTGLPVAAEIPAFPNRKQEIVELALRVQECGVVGMNLDELEVTNSNFRQLQRAGYELDTERDVVIGSLVAAEWIAERLGECAAGFGVFVCSKSCAEEAVSLREVNQGARLYPQGRQVKV